MLPSCFRYITSAGGKGAIQKAALKIEFRIAPFQPAEVIYRKHDGSIPHCLIRGLGQIQSYYHASNISRRFIFLGHYVGSGAKHDRGDGEKCAFHIVLPMTDEIAGAVLMKFTLSINGVAR